MNATDHYEVLGISRGATAAEIKRAYFQLVRRHTPEDDPATFQALSEAYRVLSDPRARRDYDSEERIAPDVAEALQRASADCEEKPDEAFAAAKRIFARAGRSPAVKFAVAAIWMRAGRAEDALPLAQELVRTVPGRPDYACLLGDALLGCKRLDAARGVLEKAIALDPSRGATYASLSQAYEALERPDDAVASLDRGIEALGASDLMSLPLRVRKLYLLARDGRFEEMDRVATAILSCVPMDDPDAVQHAWSQLVWLAQQYDQAGVFDVAKFLLDTSLQLVRHEGVAERAKRIAGVAEAQREARRAQKDPRVARWILALVQARIGRGMPEQDFRALCQRLVAQMQADVGERLREWSTFRGRYPLVAAEIEDDWNALHQAATGQSAPAASRRTRRSRHGARRASAQAKVAGGVGGVLAFIIAGALVRGLLSERKPDPPKFDLDSYVRHIQANTPSLDELQRQAVELEEKRVGRKLTPEEHDAFVDAYWKRIMDNVNRKGIGGEEKK